MMVPALESLLRLLLAFAFGALVGIERESHGRSAGLRTHALVCVAMCLLMLISLEVPVQYLAGPFEGMLRIDPGRLAQGALAGMGFIGAGVVLKGRGSIRGVTTAASLWVVSAIGLATGLGNYALSVTTTGMALVILLGLRARKLEALIPRDSYMRLQVSGPRLSAHLSEVEDVLKRYGADVLFVSLTQNLASGSMAYRFSLRFNRRPDWKGLCRDVAAVPGVERLIWLQGLVP